MNCKHRFQCFAYFSPSASGGGASAKALAGGGLSLDIIAPPASSLARPRTPPTSAGGENIGRISV